MRKSWILVIPILAITISNCGDKPSISDPHRVSPAFTWGEWGEAWLCCKRGPTQEELIEIESALLNYVRNDDSFCQTLANEAFAAMWSGGQIGMDPYDRWGDYNLDTGVTTIDDGNFGTGLWLADTLIHEAWHKYMHRVAGREVAKIDQSAEDTAGYCTGIGING